MKKFDIVTHCSFYLRGTSFQNSRWEYVTQTSALWHTGLREKFEGRQKDRLSARAVVRSGIATLALCKLPTYPSRRDVSFFVGAEENIIYWCDAKILDDSRLPLKWQGKSRASKKQTQIVIQFKQNGVEKVGEKKNNTQSKGKGKTGIYSHFLFFSSFFFLFYRFENLRLSCALHNYFFFRATAFSCAPTKKLLTMKVLTRGLGRALFFQGNVRNI